MNQSALRPIIIGAGPAGLTAAYELSQHQTQCLVLEADTVVGGLSRTGESEGYRFDIGGHRFFTKVDTVQRIWQEILGEDFLLRPRLSRIYYRGILFDYPLKPTRALRDLGAVESVRIGLSYLCAKLRPIRPEISFEHWVRNRFGKRLYEIFFKTYTEKVWGMPCSEISADWASQRIKDLDLFAALRQALLPKRKNGEVLTSLIEEFQYPRFGPGQMWQRCTQILEERGSVVQRSAKVKEIVHAGGRVEHLVVEEAGESRVVPGSDFLSSMPLRSLIRALSPAAPPEIQAAAERLRYRDFLTVVLIVDHPELFPDNWIYIHAPDVQVGRIQNYKNWSAEMVPDSSKTALGLEYFVQRGERLWEMSDEELVKLGRDECQRLGLASADSVDRGVVLRMPKAYPVYDRDYQQAIATIRSWLSGLENLQCIGRNGQHRYNNQDHSMMTGVLAAQNVLGQSHDIWEVNVEQSYHETQTAKSSDRLVPQSVPLES